MKNKYRKILALISALLFFLILRKINFSELIDIFKNVNLYTYLIGFILIFFSQFLIAYRWKMTLPKIEGLKYGSLFNQILTSYLFNNFFLSIFGGDIYKVSRIYKIVGKFNAIASIIYNRIINIYAAAIFPILVLPFVFYSLTENSFAFWSIVFSGISA
ncbi:MAG: lysylphosphatidylglycerol synthase domain-containing protein, partial [Candidatus Delongbacteria bacterium]|nr:lysylphosphatidylglycerol synthase domain-containing protein [Candidatus Delongbacteria bacterium]